MALLFALLPPMLMMPSRMPLPILPLRYAFADIIDAFSPVIDAIIFAAALLSP